MVKVDENDTHDSITGNKPPCTFHSVSAAEEEESYVSDSSLGLV